MSAQSSSVSGRSWRAAPDIIDLDKFMRGSVRPPTRRHESDTRRDKLVVDAGGVERKITAMAKLGGSVPPTGVSGAVAAAAGPAAVTSLDYSSSSASTMPPQGKRFSHDSGLSDGSYKKRKQRPLRRATLSEVSRKTHSAARTVAGGASSDSLRAFRAVCERALLDQQVQIARVAELCERLSERQKAAPAPPAVQPAPPKIQPKFETSSQRSTDETSTTLSSRSRDPRRKDKHRTEECKTYKIIMNKLDELNRLFVSRPPAGPRAPRQMRPAPPSSASVSVSDKLVSTEPGLMQVTRILPCTHVAMAHARAAPCTSLKTERLVMGDSAATFTSTCDARCGFDLEDPIHLYSQAKRLQALPVLKRRARSVEPALDHRFSDRFGLHLGEHAGAHAGRCDSHETSLCSLCRGYWRSFRQYILTQVFCYPNDNY